MGIDQCYGDVLRLSGTFYVVSSGAGERLFGFVQLAVDTIGVCDFDVLVRRVVRK